MSLKQNLKQVDHLDLMRRALNCFKFKSDFLSFLKDLESNLRIVDMSSIQFSSDSNTGLNLSSSSSSTEAYKYNFKIKTYWLKN